MRTCPHCQAVIKGTWKSCPLCNTSLAEADKEEKPTSSFLQLPLKFNRQKAIQVFFRVSLLLVLLYFVVHYFWGFQFFGLEYVLFGLLITWTLIVIMIRKSRNIAKAITYILFFISLVSIYFDYLNGWLSWSLTFVIPILSISALLAMSISIQVVDLKVEDYVLYLQLAATVGLVPLVFLIMDWVGHPLPSIISVVFSLLVFVVVLLRYRMLLIRELQKRMHI
jgi:hypothetical protein